jgi:hypothetical protein
VLTPVPTVYQLVVVKCGIPKNEKLQYVESKDADIEAIYSSTSLFNSVTLPWSQQLLLSLWIPDVKRFRGGGGARLISESGVIASFISNVKAAIQTIEGFASVTGVFSPSIEAL